MSYWQTNPRQRRKRAVAQKKAEQNRGAARLLSVNDAAEYIGRTPGAVRMMIFHQKFPQGCVVRCGSRVHLDVKALDQWIEAQKCR